MGRLWLDLGPIKRQDIKRPFFPPCQNWPIWAWRAWSQVNSRWESIKRNIVPCLSNILGQWWKESREERKENDGRRGKKSLVGFVCWSERPVLRGGKKGGFLWGILFLLHNIIIILIIIIVVGLMCWRETGRDSGAAKRGFSSSKKGVVKDS